MNPENPQLPELNRDGVARLISVIVPCRNERAFIEAFCDDATAQRLPQGWRMELIVADGVSDDGTAQLLAQRSAQVPASSS